MTLPTKPLATERVVIAGETIEYRALSRSEAMKLREFEDDPDAAEVYIIATGAQVSPEDAKTFRDTNDTETAGILIDNILILSGLAKRDEDGNVEAIVPGRDINGVEIPNR